MVAQTTYTRDYAPAFAGQIGDVGPWRIESRINDQGADIPAGIFVTEKALGETIDLPAGATEKLCGVVVNSFARDPNSLTGTNAIKAGNDLNVMAEGTIWVVCEEAMAVNDPVYVRYASGTGTQLGAVRNDADTSTCRQVKGAKVLIPSTGAGVVMIYFSRAADTATL